MSVQEVLTRCRDLGVNLWPAPNGNLRIAPPGRLPEDLREALRHHKQEVLALLLAEKIEAPSRPCSACGKPAEVEEVDGQGRTFWVCPYCQATAEIGDSYQPVISWLTEYHPERWEAIKQADDHLTTLERKGSTEKEYHVALEHFLNLLREAKQEWESTHVLYDNRKGVKVWVQ